MPETETLAVHARQGNAKAVRDKGFCAAYCTPR